jgi:hypothetical protein
MMISTLRLFNAVQVDKLLDIEMREKVLQDTNKADLERMISNGYVLDPSILFDDQMLDAIEKVVGISGEKANATFHKSWKVVRDTPMAILFIQQLLHYFTTYGLEGLGLYREDMVYIPHETLDLPFLQEDVPLVVIKAMTAEMILEKIVALGSGIALAQDTLNDIMAIVEFNKYDPAFVADIKNRELKAILSDLYGLVPTDPEGFLRHLISKLTDESLVIKNRVLIAKIKDANGKFLDELIKDAPDDLASIFYRYKPLFLAMKSISKNKTFFNRLRKKAPKMHKPLRTDYLNDVTSQIKHGTLDTKYLWSRLQNAVVFRKIRLAYALQSRLNPADSIVYKVRNGRGWVTTFEWNEKLYDMTKQTLDLVLESVADSIRENVEGKIFYIPENIHYALPATEKQFTGFLPSGSYVSVPEDMIVGVHWENQPRLRIDLDLSSIGESGKIGWNTRYRSQDLTVLFSGDVVDARLPKGASELFYFNTEVPESKLMYINYYNYSETSPVECKILVAHEHPNNFGKNYTVDPSNIVASANVIIERKQYILGLMANVDGENRFYFSQTSVGNSIFSTAGGRSTQIRQHMMNSLINSIYFRQVLEAAGARIWDEIPVPPPEGAQNEEYVDLSPSALDKTTLIDLVQPHG